MSSIDKPTLQVGDRLVVLGIPFPAYIESFEFDNKTQVLIIHLDWKEHGKSKVYAHDENKIWYRYSESN